MLDSKREVIIVERDVELAHLYLNLINQSENYQVKGLFSNNYEALKASRNIEPSVYLMSVDIPTQHDLNDLERIKTNNKLIRIIVHLGFLDIDWVLKAIVQGADSFVLKSNRLTDIERALNTVSADGAYFSPEIVKKLVVSNQRNLRSPLSTRETEVLQLMREGMTYSMISRKLNISVHTTRTHMKNIYAKLSVSRKAEAIRKAYIEKLV